MKEVFLPIATISYMIGILVGIYLNKSISLFAMLFTIILVYVCIYNKPQKKNIIFLIITMSMIIFFGMMHISYIDSSYKKIYKEIKNIDEDIKVEAIVISSAQEKDYSVTYNIKVLKINEKKINKKIKFQISLKKNQKNKNNLIKLNYGDLIEIKGEFKIPNEARNYKGFNYMQYLKTNKIYGTMNVDSSIKVLKHNQANIIDQTIYNVQNDIKSKIKKIVPKETEDLCIGILIGDKENLSEDVQEQFRQSNLTHMLAVSGAHMSYIILGISILFSKLEKKISKICTILLLIIFMALTGFTPSVTRAGIMAIITIMSKLFYRKANIFNSLAISTLIILLENPYTILNIGFQLSYAGTIGIILLDQRIWTYICEKYINIRKNKKIEYIIKAIIVTISANIIIIPIMAYQFNTISITFWISNLLASPLMGVAVILGFLTYFISLIFFPIANILGIFLHFILTILLKIAQYCSLIPYSNILVKTPYLIFILIYYCFIILLIQQRKIKEFIKRKESVGYKKRLIRIRKNICKRKREYILIISILLCIFFTIIIKNNQILKIYFIDVGQGDASLIITPSNKKILIDGGGSETGNFYVGERILLPYLLDRRIKTLDYVFISHFDTDHVRTEY